jgi:hypothetical protein
MSLRHILCEGPDDLTALREIGLHAFGAQLDRQSSQRGAGAGGEARKALLRTATARVEIVAGRSGKSALPREIAADLAQLPPQIEPQGEATVDIIAVVFDPDGDPEASFHREIEKNIAAHATGWSLVPKASSAWTATREAGEVVEIVAIPWRAPGNVIDGLPDYRNLERVLCAVLARAYQAEAAIVERWLTEIQTRKPGWKAALHLWCALVEEKANELNVAARVLHQNAACRPHALDVLREAGLLTDLQPLFA